MQDAFLGRGTSSPYLAIMNHMGIRRDENAPKAMPPEVMQMIGPSALILRLEATLDGLRRTLAEKHGRVTHALGDEWIQLK